MSENKINYEARVKEVLQVIDHALSVDTSDLPGGVGAKGIYADGIRAGVKMACENIKRILESKED